MYKHEVFTLVNQAEHKEDTYAYLQETENGKIAIRFSGENKAKVFIETLGEEIRILVYGEDNYDIEEPEIIVLDAISGGW